MNLRELKRSLQEKTFVINNNTVQNFEILATMLTEDNNIIKGRLDKITLDKESKTITLHFFECFSRS